MLKFMRLAISMGCIFVIAACKSNDPVPSPSSTPSSPLPERVIIAIQNLATYDSYVQTTTEYITNQTFLKRDGETIYSLETDTETTTVSRVNFVNGSPNVSADVMSSITGTERENENSVDLDYGVQAELRLVDDTLYLQATPSDVDGWQIVAADNLPEFAGSETLNMAGWLNFTGTQGRMVGRMGDWMLNHYTTAEALTAQATEINSQDGTLEDGTPVDVIRFLGDGMTDGVANTIPIVANTSEGQAVLQAGIQYPTIAFVIDQENRLRSRIISYNVFVENIQPYLIMDAEQDMRLSIILTVNIVESYSSINAELQPVNAPITLE